MGFRIREIETECKFSSALTIDALGQAIPADAITQVIAQEGVGEVRERRLTAALTVWLVIALHLFPTVAISGVFRKLARGLRLFWPDPEVALPTDSALSLSTPATGRPPARGLVSPGLPSNCHIPDPRCLFVWVATDGYRWHQRRRARYPRQCQSLRTAYQCAWSQRLSATPRCLSDRVWHSRRCRCRLLALPYQRTSRRLASAALGEAWHAADVGPWLSRLRHAAGGAPARRTCPWSLASPRQAAAAAYSARRLGAGLSAALGLRQTPSGRAIAGAPGHLHHHRPGPARLWRGAPADHDVVEPTSGPGSRSGLCLSRTLGDRACV